MKSFSLRDEFIEFIFLNPMNWRERINEFLENFVDVFEGYIKEIGTNHVIYATNEGELIISRDHLIGRNYNRIHLRGNHREEMMNYLRCTIMGGNNMSIAA